MEYRFRQKIIGPLVVAWIFVLVAGFALSTLVWKRFTASIQTSFDATRVSAGLERLCTSLLDAETGQRGFLLTGNESYLEPFNAAESSIVDDFKNLSAWGAGDASMQNDLLELRGLAELKMREMRDSISIRRDKGMSAAVQFINADKGKADMDRLRKLVAAMDEKQRAIVARGGEVIQQRTAWMQRMRWITGFLAIGAGVFALYLVRISYLLERDRHQLSEDKQRAEKAVKEKSAFLANISHEIRTPMNAILGFGELLESESLTPSQATYVKSLRRSGDSLLQLINDVLDLSKLEAGKLEIHREPTDLGEICNFLQTMFGQQAAVKSVELKFEMAGIPGALLLDRLRVRQVLVNLVGNAVKFTARGHVCTRAEWLHESGDGSRGTVLVHVADTGIGISPEKQAEIFHPFVQSNPSGTMEHEGTGLGLHIVQRLTQIMGGSVTLESTPGKGSVFHLRFPEISVSARLPVSDSADIEEIFDFNDFASAILLVVDDNDTNRELIGGIFKHSHHRIRFACNGQEALASIMDTKPNLVLLDIRMPVMNGHEVLLEIRRKPGLELLPVVAVTASSQEGDERELRSRFNGYVRKPFTRRTLYRELSQFLPRISREQEPGGSTPGGLVASPSGCKARQAGDWESMVAELRQLQAAHWAGLRESIAINETKAFAKKLRTLAQPNQCSPLMAYAESLAAHAHNYAVSDLEKLLAEFPALLQAIEQRPNLTLDG